MDRRAEWTTAALGASMLAALVPLGLASGEAADQAAQALGARRPFALHAPLADTLARAAVMVPAGEAATRPLLVATLAGAAALALLLARLRSAQNQRPGLGTAVGIAAGVALVAVSRPFLEVACLRPGLAVDFALLVAMGTMVEGLRRDPTRSRLGLGLAFACGLAAGAGWPVRAAVWPLALGMTIWALWRGVRWPLVAPLLFVAGTAVAFGGVVAAGAGPSNTLGAFVRQIVFPVPPSTVSVTARAAVAVAIEALRAVAVDAGMLVALVAALGAWVLFLRAPVETVIAVVVAGGAVVAALAQGDPLFARLMTMAMMAAPAAAAIGYLTQSFGRARAAAAIVVAVIVVVPPAVVGVGAAVRLPARGAPNAVARRLDATFDGGGRQSVPVAGEAAPWLRYVRAVGANPPPGP